MSQVPVCWCPKCWCILEIKVLLQPKVRVYDGQPIFLLILKKQNRETSCYPMINNKREMTLFLFSKCKTKNKLLIVFLQDVSTVKLGIGKRRENFFQYLFYGKLLFWLGPGSDPVPTHYAHTQHINGKLLNHVPNWMGKVLFSFEEENELR